MKKAIENFKRKNPIDSYSIEGDNYDYIRQVVKETNGKNAFGYISKSDIVNTLLTLFKTNITLRNKVLKTIEQNEIKSDMKLIKKFGMSYIKKLRRSNNYRERLKTSQI
jgi:hypothetical protein